MSVAKKLKGDRKKVYKALVHLKKTDAPSYRRALKSLTGGPVKNPPASNEEIAQLVEKLDLAKVQAATQKGIIKGALEEMKSAAPARRVELMRRGYEAGRRKKKIEKDIVKLIRDISLKTAESQGKIFEQKSDKIAELSLKSQEVAQRLDALETQIEKAKGSSEKLLPLYQKRQSLQRVASNIAKEQNALARGMRRELFRAEFAANEDLVEAGVEEPGAARLLSERIDVLDQINGAKGARLAALKNKLNQIDRQLERVSSIYSGHLSIKALKDLSKQYEGLAPGVTRQIALRKKLEDAARGARRKEEIAQINQRIKQINVELAGQFIDAKSKREATEKKKTLQSMLKERRFETEVLALVEAAIERKEKTEEPAKRSKYEPADKELYELAKQVIEIITETCKSVGEYYANCLHAMDTVYSITAGKDRATLNRHERQALKDLGKQRGTYMRLIAEEIRSFGKQHAIAKIIRYAGTSAGKSDVLDRLEEMYFGLTPEALRIVTSRRGATQDEGGWSATSDIKKIIGGKRTNLGAAYVYGIMLYLNQVPKFDEEKLPKHMQGGVFVYPPLTADVAGIEKGFLGLRAVKVKAFKRGTDLLPPFSLMGPFQSAYDQIFKERLWQEAKGDTLRAQVAKDFISEGSSDFKLLAILGDEGKFAPNEELTKKELASRGLYFDIHKIAQVTGLQAAEKQAEAKGLEWRLPQAQTFYGQRLKGYQEFEGFEYKKPSADAWIRALKKNKKNATIYIYTELLGGEMLGELAEAAKTGAFGSDQIGDIDYFGLGYFSDEEDFSFTDAYIRPPIVEGKAWLISSNRGDALMCGYLDKDQHKEEDIRRELIWAVGVLAFAQQKRPISQSNLDWLLLRKPWMAPKLADKIKVDAKRLSKEDIDDLATFVEGLTAHNPIQDRLATPKVLPSNFVYGELQRLNKEDLAYKRAAAASARDGLEKLRAESDLKDSEREYARTRGLNEFANRLKITSNAVTAGVPFWTYVLIDRDTRRPLAMGFALDKAGARQMANKRDQLISKVFDSREGASPLTYTQLSAKDQRLLLEPNAKLGKHKTTYFSPEIFQALVPTKQEIDEIGQSTYKKLKERSAIFTARGDLQKTGVESALEDQTVLPKTKGKISSYEPDDEDANYTIEIRALKPGEQYEVRAVFHEIDDDGNRVDKPTPWVGAIGVDIKGLKGQAKKMAKRYKGRVTAKELEKNPALCKCLVTGEYMAGVRKGNESFIREYEQNPKKTVKKYSVKKNPTEDVTDIFEGAAFAEQTQRIPGDPTQAYKIGYSEGIIEGLNLCGVKNYFARRRLKRDYERAIKEARKRMREQVTGIRLGKQVAAPVIEQEEEEDLLSY